MVVHLATWPVLTAWAGKSRGETHLCVTYTSWLIMTSHRIRICLPLGRTSLSVVFTRLCLVYPGLGMSLLLVLSSRWGAALTGSLFVVAAFFMWSSLSSGLVLLVL